MLNENKINKRKIKVSHESKRKLIYIVIHFFNPVQNKRLKTFKCFHSDEEGRRTQARQYFKVSFDNDALFHSKNSISRIIPSNRKQNFTDRISQNSL